MNDTTFQGDGEIAFVPVVVNAKPTKKTNADRIRSMTDEELAEWIERIRVLCANEFCGKACPLHDACFSFAEQPTEMLDWLKQEAEE